MLAAAYRVCRQVDILHGSQDWSLHGLQLDHHGMKSSYGGLSVAKNGLRLWRNLCSAWLGMNCCTFTGLQLQHKNNCIT